MKTKQTLSGLALFCAMTVSLPGIARESEGKSTVQGTLKVEKHSESEFPDLAKIGLQEAMKIATENVKGKVLQAGLEKKNGYLVYSIEVVTPEKESKELDIDAATGKVLSLKVDKADNDKESEEDDD